MYFEAHVTVGSMSQDMAEVIEGRFGWKNSEVTFDSDPDEIGKFCTFRHTDINLVQHKIEKLVEYLKGHDIVVRRYKVELAVVDSNKQDVWKLL